LGRRPCVDLGEHGIEPSQAAKAGAQCDLRHREVGFVEQPFGPLHASGLCHLQRAGTKVLLKEPAEVSGTDAKSVRQHFDTAAIEGTAMD
jgi:hypothetical protein